MSDLVFHHGALGDGVLIWPLLRAWAPCALVARHSRARLAARWIQGVRAIDGDSAAATALFGSGDLPVGPLRDRLTQARRIVSFLSDGDDAWAANVRRLAPGAELICLAARPDESRDTHVHQFHLEQLRLAGVAVEPLHPPARANRDGPVVIHPGSGGAGKCWPADRFEALVGHLAAIGREAIVALGEAELERWPADRLARWRGVCEVVTSADVIALSELIARASVYIGNDSGPTHLAAQLGVPTLALFGPTDPRVWRPIGPAVRVLAPPTARSMDWLAPEVVAEAAARW